MSGGQGQDGEAQRGHDRGEDQGERHEPGQEAQLLGRRALRHLRHQEAQERRGVVTQVTEIGLSKIALIQGPCRGEYFAINALNAIWLKLWETWPLKFVLLE